jgi:hypothetical protein
MDSASVAIGTNNIIGIDEKLSKDVYNK